MRTNTSKVRLVKGSFGGLRTPVECTIFFFFLVSLIKGYLMDTIDFNKHDRHFHKFGKNSSLWQILRPIVQ
jgi:hypothetical protein